MSPLVMVVAIAAAAAVIAAFMFAGESGQSGRRSRDALDELVAIAREASAAQKDATLAARASAAALKDMSDRIAALDQALSASKRAAVALRLEVETACRNDPDCGTTAKLVCSRIGYPNGITSHFTSGQPPNLNSLVCFD